MEIENFEEFYILQLERLLDAERQLLQALQNIAAAVQSAELRGALQQHRAETGGQVKRLEKLLADMGEDPRADTCDVMQALVDEADDLVAAIEESPLRDAALVGACNKVEHFEMAAYEGVRMLAVRLGRMDAVVLLEQSLAEEKAASDRLVEIGAAM